MSNNLEVDSRTNGETLGNIRGYGAKSRRRVADAGIEQFRRKFVRWIVNSVVVAPVASLVQR
jgi:hypothetical protein